MTGGSLQLRRYMALRRGGASTEDAAASAGIDLPEARSWDAEEAKGELGWVGEPFAEKPPAIGHNSGASTMSEGNVAADQLRRFIERIERMEEEKRGIADDIKDVYSEAKGQGYDTRTLREIVKLRKMDKHVRDEREALLETYKAALGMDFAGTPLGIATLARAA